MDSQRMKLDRDPLEYRAVRDMGGHRAGSLAGHSVGLESDGDP